MNKLSLFATLLSLWFSNPCVSQNTPLSSQVNFDRCEVFEEVVQFVERNFYDADFNKTNWSNNVERFKLLATQSDNYQQFSAAVNQLLRTLNASHTAYFSKLNPRRYQLLGIMHQIFEKRDDVSFEYEGIGIETHQTQEGFFIHGVYEGHSAATAGLQFGDRIVAVNQNPFDPILSFQNKAGQNVEVLIKRAEKTLTIPIRVELLDARTMFEKAMDASVRIIRKNKKQIGYVHIWCYGGYKFQEKLRDLVLWGKLAKCDSLIVDLRDGWGGADINYLNLFRPPIAEVESIQRDGSAGSFSGVWGKPVALITNQRTTSGKELFTYGFKKLKLGKVFGETTAGAVLAGRCFVLSNGDVLYLAVTDVKVDGIRIESVGVTPDVTVIRKSGPVDAQLNTTIEYLSNLTKEN